LFEGKGVFDWYPRVMGGVIHSQFRIKSTADDDDEDDDEDEQPASRLGALAGPR
jgi:hypothetical protein